MISIKGSVLRTRLALVEELAPGDGLKRVLARLTSRQVNVLNAIGATGAVTTANVIPASARAITYNLTATGTTGRPALAAM